MISWSSRKQQTVAASSCKAEYMAASHCTKEVLWLRNLLGCLEITQANATVLLHCNNQGAIALTKDASLHSCSKHIDVAHHLVWEHVEMNQIIFQYLPTHKMPADTLTMLHPKSIPRLTELGDRTMGCRTSASLLIRSVRHHDYFVYPSVPEFCFPYVSCFRSSFCFMFPIFVLFHVSDLRFVSCFHSYSHFPFRSIFDPRAQTPTLTYARFSLP